ncbi:MAG: hypothetical protein ACUVQZ_10455 [Candidatus Caldatribacteriaceae bacterium]
MERIRWDDLWERVKVLLPLLQGWNPDCLVAVNTGGILLGGLIHGVLPKEVRVMIIKEEPWEIVWESVGDLRGKRVVILAGRISLESVWEKIEGFLKERGALSVLKMVILGRKGDYSCFPEKNEVVLLPWEDYADR